MSTFNQIANSRSISPPVIQDAKNDVVTTVLDIDPPSPDHRRKLGWHWWKTSNLSGKSGLQRTSSVFIQYSYLSWAELIPLTRTTG